MSDLEQKINGHAYFLDGQHTLSLLSTNQVSNFKVDRRCWDHE